MPLSPMNLPVGVRFDPTDEELLRHYLQRKVEGHNHGDERFIPEMDVYAKEPWLLPHQNSSHLKENHWYYFVKRARADGTSSKGKRPKRTIEGDLNSSWRASVADQKILSRDGQLLGHKKVLTFVTNKKRNKGDGKSVGTKTDWLMTEYCLASNSFQEWVICHIRYNGKEKTVGGNDAEGIGDGEETGLRPDEKQFANNLASMLLEEVTDTSLCTEEPCVKLDALIAEFTKIASNDTQHCLSMEELNEYLNS